MTKEYSLKKNKLKSDKRVTKDSYNPANSEAKLHQNGIKSNSGNDIELPPEVEVPDVKVSNIIGDFGPYQISVVIFAALRALSCAMDGLSGPFISPNIKDYQCQSCYNSNLTLHNNIGSGLETNCSLYAPDGKLYNLDTTRCYFSDAESQNRINCNKWDFNFEDNMLLMKSLTIEQSLVCDREWLKSLSNSLYFIGATLGLLFWGVISDKYGRKTAYVCSHFITIIFGFSALYANSMTSYIILRSINSFGMIGELIPRSIQVEIVATEYRFICSVICQIGWASGVILVPAMAYINPGYRFILSFPLVLTIIMIPWLYWLPESARWLIANQKFERARTELRRAAKINGKLDEFTDSKIEQFNRQVLREEVGCESKHRRIGIGRSIMAIFTNMNLLKDTLSVFVLLFVAEVVYFSLTLNVADLGGSLYINYIISGFSEYFSIAFCAVILAYLSRRTCLTLLLFASTISYLVMALVNVYENSLSTTLILVVNAFGKLTAIGNLMVIILVSQEVFPTVIRQFGTSLCITVGKTGSAFAPFTHELGQMIGQKYCFGLFSLICFTCAFIPFFLSETGNRELPDTVVDVEESAKGDSRKSKDGRSKNLKNVDLANDNAFVAHYKSNKSIPRIKYINDDNNNNINDSTAVEKDCNNNSIELNSKETNNNYDLDLYSKSNSYEPWKNLDVLDANGYDANNNQPDKDNHDNINDEKQ